jgi:hypothetical protein
VGLFLRFLVVTIMPLDRTRKIASIDHTIIPKLVVADTHRFRYYRQDVTSAANANDNAVMPLRPAKAT